ncbi:uncharacterized protein [Ptychodera flava]|uniref:uncharacterized protein n=1 Tax=Ptychodera flava TaxID=63121 RepID=UPI00396A8A52
MSEYFEEQLVKEGTQVLPGQNVDERVSSLVRSLLLFQTSDIQVNQYLVEYLLELGQTVTNSKIDVEKIILECQLNEADREKAALEKQIGDLSKRSDSKEFIRKTSEMKYELLKKEKIIGELQGRLAKLEGPHLTPSDLHQTEEGFEHQYTASKGETEASGLHQPDETERSKTEYSRMMETEHEQYGHPTHPHTDMPTFRKRQLEADQKKEALPQKKPQSTDSGIKTSHGAEASITSVTKDKTGKWHTFSFKLLNYAFLIEI